MQSAECTESLALAQQAQQQFQFQNNVAMHHGHLGGQGPPMVRLGGGGAPSGTSNIVTFPMVKTDNNHSQANNSNQGGP